MKLSAEQFAELAASFDATRSSSKHERRRAARLDLQAKIRIRPVMIQPLDPILVVVSNFSARGLSLVHSVVMEPGQQFITELPRKGGGCVELLCTVVHCKPGGPDTWRIGAEFTCVAPVNPSDTADSTEMKRISQTMLG